MGNKCFWDKISRTNDVSGQQQEVAASSEVVAAAASIAKPKQQQQQKTQGCRRFWTLWDVFDVCSWQQESIPSEKNDEAR